MDVGYTLARPLSDIVDWKRTKSADLTWRSFLHAQGPEQYSEVMWARKRKGMPASLPSLSAAAFPTGDGFFNSLLESEKVRLQTYLANHSIDLCVASLGQDPDFTRAASGEELLHTIVRNPGLMWMPELSRWMTAREQLYAQLFPVTNESLSWVHEGLPGSPRLLTSYNFSRLASLLPPRTRIETMHQSGNTMNVVVVGSVLMHLCLYLRPSVVSVPKRIPLAPLALTDETSSDTVNLSSRLSVWKAARSSASLSVDCSGSLVVSDDSDVHLSRPDASDKQSEQSGSTISVTNFCRSSSISTSSASVVSECSDTATSAGSAGPSSGIRLRRRQANANSRGGSKGLDARSLSLFLSARSR